MREVRAASLTGFIEVSYFVGLDPFELLRKSNISPRFLDDSENRHAALPVLEMIEDAAAESDCDAFGLLMAECRTFASLGPLSLLLQHLGSIDEVLDALNHYRRFMNDVVSLECIRGAESSVFCWIVAPGLEWPQVVDLTVALGHRILSEASGGKWSPEVIHFRHSAPHELEMFRRYFSCPIEFDSKFNGYSCATESLHSLIPRGEVMMAEHARRLLELVPDQGEFTPVTDSVQRAISLLLPYGGAKLAGVAANLGLTSRLLQRRLALEGTSFERLLNLTRKEIAERFLLASDQSVGFVAELLGYSTTAAFSRWFSTEYGMPPLAWRKQHKERQHAI